ncbi:MAG: hypothetical protein OXE59_02315 [Bacteroidetes bacterium]|nr:hypothetical protein [Bacteroidota bacterium]
MSTGTGTAWGDQVIVFDWNGIPKALLQIEDGALKIGISGDGRDLYAIYHSPTPLILRYELPDIPLIFTTIEFKINFTKTESFFRGPSLPL